MKEAPEYSIEVYKNHALVRGSLQEKSLSIIIKMGEIHGFTHLTNTEEQGIWKLVRKKGKNERL